MKTWVILSGGLLEPEFVRSYLNQLQGPLGLVAADKGLEAAWALGLIPNAFVGDMDSFSEKEKEYQLNRLKTAGIPIELHKPEKDATDTELALQYVLSRHPESIHILGGTGSRLDHVLANIALLEQALKVDIPCCMADPHNRIRLLCKEQIFQKKDLVGKYISFLPYSDVAEKVSLKGFKYPLHNMTLEKGSSLGVSNELLEDVGEMTLSGGLLLCIESSD